MERLVTASGYEGVLRHKGVRPELVGRLGRCGHMYHLLCLVAMYSNGNKVGGAGAGGGAGTPRGGASPPASPAPGRQPAVPHVQGHLRREDGHPAAREDAVPPHPALAAWLRRHPDHPHRLRHPHRHPGEAPVPLAPAPRNPAQVPHTCPWLKRLLPAPHRALSTPTQARSSPQEASRVTATCPTTRRAGRWVLGGCGVWEQAGDPPHPQSLFPARTDTDHHLLVRVQPRQVASHTWAHFQLEEVKVLTPFYR